MRGKLCLVVTTSTPLPYYRQHGVTALLLLLFYPPLTKYSTEGYDAAADGAKGLQCEAGRGRHVHCLGQQQR